MEISQWLLRTFVEFLEMVLIPTSGNARSVIFIACLLPKGQQRDAWLSCKASAGGAYTEGQLPRAAAAYYGTTSLIFLDGEMFMT